MTLRDKIKDSMLILGLVGTLSGSVKLFDGLVSKNTLEHTASTQVKNYTQEMESAYTTIF